GADVEVDRSLFAVPKPDYVPEIVDLVEDLVDDSEQSTDLPQIVDIIMSEWFLKENRERRVRRIFPNDALAQRTAAAQRFLRRLLKLEAVPRILEELFRAAKNGNDESKHEPDQGTSSV